MKNPKRESISSVGNTDEKKRRRRRRKLLADICSQVEFYFSDANLRKDRFLGQEIRQSSDGYVPLEMIASFNKIRSLTEDRKVLVKALHKSKLVELSLCGTQLKRKKPLEEPKYDPDDCTVYVECLPKTADIDWIQKTFRYCGNVVYVSLPRYQSTRDIKGFAFVEYETPEEATRACQLLNNPLDDYGPPGLFPKTRKGRYINVAQPDGDGSGEAKTERNRYEAREEGKHHHKHSEHRDHGRKHHHHKEEDKHVHHDRKESREDVLNVEEKKNVGKNIDTDEKHHGEKEKGREKRRRKKGDVKSVEDSEAGNTSGKKKRKRAEDVDELKEEAWSEAKGDRGQGTERLEGGKEVKEKETDGNIHGNEGNRRDKKSSRSVEGAKEPQTGDSHGGLNDAGERQKEGNKEGERQKEGNKEGEGPQDMGGNIDEASALCDNGKQSEKDHIKGVQSEDARGKKRKAESIAKPEDEIQSGTIPIGKKECEDNHGEAADGIGTGKTSKGVRKRKRTGEASAGSGEVVGDGGGREHHDKKRKHREGAAEKKSRGEESCPSGKEGKGARRKRRMTNDENVAGVEVPDDKKETTKLHRKENAGDGKGVGVERGEEKDAKSALKEIKNADRGGVEEAKKKKRTRQQKKDKEEPQLFLRVLSKAEWLRLKEQYLHLQKIGFQEMKEAMRAQWRGIVKENRKNGKVEEEKPSKPVAPSVNQEVEPPKTSNIEFVEGVVVSITAKEPVSSRKTLREQLEAVSPVAYVDLKDGETEGFVRFKTRRAAETVVSHKFESLSGIAFQLIKGEEEKAYWDKLRADQENKLNSSGNKRKKKRGRQRIMDRALKSAGPTSHTRFDGEA